LSPHFASSAPGPARFPWRNGVLIPVAAIAATVLSLVGCQSGPAAKAVVPVAEPAAVDSGALSADYERALTLLGAGDFAMAAAELETLSAANPDLPGPLLNLGIAYAKAGKLPEAEQSFKMAIARKADSAAAYNQLGIVYRKLGKFKDAGDAYQRAIEIDPGYALAHLNLGVLYDMYLQQPDLALAEFERYVSIAGDTDAAVNGWIKEIRSRLDGAARGARSKS
jgi:tetratricopeptide (TPR) repeat protein